MELVVFDLDGTLLNADSVISEYTKETLHLLAERGILYTVATGRALHGARDILKDHPFTLPQAFKNGVMIWSPAAAGYSHHTHLTIDEIRHVLDAMHSQALTPFLFTLEPGDQHAIYHPELRTSYEEELAESYRSRSDVAVRPAGSLPAEAEISNISALGTRFAVEGVERLIQDEAELVAYAGPAIEGDDLWWIDIHHIEASKGNAVTLLRKELGVSRVVCFGDSDNDLSMFAIADEAYAPANARADVKEAATAVIGHHDEDGIARFLRERFELPTGERRS